MRRPVRFGVFEADISAGTLRKNGARVPLQQKPFRMLATLLAKPGQIVTREELHQALWPDEEFGDLDLRLNQAARKVRDALGDSADSPRWIETIPTIGYKFLAPVESPHDPQPAAPPQAVVDPPPPKTSWLPWALFGAAALAALVLAVRPGGAPVARLPQLHLELSAPPGIAYNPFALSPDGSRVALVGEGSGATRLWVQSLVDRSARPLEGTEGADESGAPFWSPDGRQIGFFADGKLKRVDARGGAPQTICEAPYGRGGTWNRDDVIVFAPDNRGGLWRADAVNAKCEPLLEPEEGEGSLRSPQFLPDGKRFVFTVRGSGQEVGANVNVDVASLDADERTSMLEQVWHAAFVDVPDQGGFLLYGREGALFAREFDPNRLTVGDSEIQVASGVGSSLLMTRFLFSASSSGLLAYLPQDTSSRRRELAWFDRKGNPLSAIMDVDSYGFTVQLAPSLNWALSWAYNPGGVRRIDLDRGVRTPLSSGGIPLVAPDGSYMLFTDATGIVRRKFDSTATVSVVEAEAVRPQERYAFANSIDDSSGLLLYQLRTAATGWDLWTIPLDARSAPRVFLQTDLNEAQASFSPDGRWVAYSSDESGRREVYIVAFPGAGGKQAISHSGGTLPRWRSDGKELFFVDAQGVINTVAISVRDGKLRAGPPEQIFPVSAMYSNSRSYDFAPEYTYDITPDGQRILAMWRPPDMSFPPLRVIVNWPDLLAVR